MARKTPKPNGTLTPSNGNALHKGPDIGEPIRRWWAGKSLEETLKIAPGIPSAYTDLGIACMRHLLQRLDDPKTPAIEKDRIALVMAPRLSAEVKGRLADDPGKKSELAGLLGDYGVARFGR